MSSQPAKNAVADENRSYRIGSEPGCDVVIADSSVQPLHAEVTADGKGRLAVTNRTDPRQMSIIRNGKREPLVHANLHPGETVTFGDISMSFLELVEALQFRDPGFDPNEPKPKQGSAAQGTPSRKPGKGLKKLAMLAVVIAGLLYWDYSRQVSLLDVYSDRFEMLGGRISSPTADLTSLEASKAALNQLGDDIVTSSWRWISSGLKSLAEDIEKAKALADERERQLASPEANLKTWSPSNER